MEFPMPESLRRSKCRGRHSTFHSQRTLSSRGRGRRIEMNETMASPWLTTAEAAAYLRIKSTNSSAVGTI